MVALSALGLRQYHLMISCDGESFGWPTVNTCDNVVSSLTSIILGTSENVCFIMFISHTGFLQPVHALCLLCECLLWSQHDLIAHKNRREQDLLGVYKIYLLLISWLIWVIEILTGWTCRQLLWVYVRSLVWHSCMLYYPANTRHFPNVVLMLAAVFDVGPTLGKCFVFAG